MTFNPFKQSIAKRSRLRWGMAGPPGSGKTWNALTVATTLFDKVALIDTEHGSASKYKKYFKFDPVDLDAPYHPERYMELMKAAEENGYDALVIDSISHAWFGEGGLLELVDQAAARSKSSNTYFAWRDVTPIQNKFIQSILTSKLDLICTLRSKQEYVIEEVNGKKVPRKIGMAPIQREGMEYEFDIFSETDMDHNLIIQKTRCAELDGKVFRRPTGKEIAPIISNWLDIENRLPVEEETVATETLTAWAKSLAEKKIDKDMVKQRSMDLFGSPVHLLTISQFNKLKEEIAA